MQLKQSFIIVALTASLLAAEGCAGNNRQQGGGPYRGQSDADQGRNPGLSTADQRRLDGRPDVPGGGTGAVTPPPGGNAVGLATSEDGQTIFGTSPPGNPVPPRVQAQVNESRSQQIVGAGGLGRKDPLNILHHTNIQMQSSPYISQQVAAMDELQTAMAVVTESNIYVAVRLKDHVMSQYAGQQNSPESVRSLQKAYDGIPNDANRDAVRATERTGRRKPGIRSGITGNSYDYYQDKDKQRAVKGSLNNSSVPPAVQQKVVDKVRSLSAPNIQHIYVSDDPRLLHSFTACEQKSGSQTNWNAYVNELNQIADHVFPTAEGTGAYGGSTSSGQTEHVRQHNTGPVYGETTGTR